MKIQFPLLALAAILTLGCSGSKTNNTDNFQKKLACSDKLSTIENKLAQMKQNSGNSIVGDYNLAEVFYIPNLNTCAYGYNYREELCGLNYGCSKPEDYEYQDVYIIEDILTGKELYHERYSNGSNENVAAFQNKIIELQK
ncbi:MAG: hypothetical protein PHU04_04225 [Candidatus Peribacteraceae bacterium]|nr:hypothetical protein [Candidatus Peribacteraceae bacterium]